MWPLLLTLLTSAPTSPTPVASGPEAALPSDDFVESVGVNTHLDFGNTPYVTQFDQVKTLLLAAGFRYIRVSRVRQSFTHPDGGTTYALDPLVESMVEAGVRLNFLADLNSGAPEDVRDMVKGFNAQHPGAIASVEGPNEPDGFWARLYPSGYQGQGFPAGAIQFQKDLYATLKADPETKDLDVFGIALGLAGNPPCTNSNPLGNSGELAGSVDYANFHPYPGGNPWHPDITYDFTDNYYHMVLLPTSMLDPTPAPGLTDHDDVVCMGKKPYGAKPFVATETGVALFDGGVPEKHLAALMPRILLENFRLGIHRSFLYELVDTDVADGAYGLLHADLTPKPSYPAIQLLLHTLADPGPTFTPGSLDYMLEVSPVTVPGSGVGLTFDKLSYVHHLLFQKRDGTFELLLWHEIATDVTYPSEIDLSPPPLPGTLTLGQPFAHASVTTVDETGAASVTSVDPAQPIALQISERFQVVELTPASAVSSGDAGIALPGEPARVSVGVTTIPGWTCQGVGGALALPELCLVLAALLRRRAR